jgi:hypothetical protein
MLKFDTGEHVRSNFGLLSLLRVKGRLRALGNGSPHFSATTKQKIKREIIVISNNLH